MSIQHEAAHMYTQQQGAARNRTLRDKRKNSSEIITQIQKIAHKIVIHILQEHIKKIHKFNRRELLPVVGTEDGNGERKYIKYINKRKTCKAVKV